MAKLSENARKVFDYVKSIDGVDVTADDIAKATDLTTKQVNGIVTAAFQKKGLMERVPAEIEIEDAERGTIHKMVKFIKFTPLGDMFDPDTQE